MLIIPSVCRDSKLVYELLKCLYRLQLIQVLKNHRNFTRVHDRVAIDDAKDYCNLNYFELKTVHS